MKIKHYWNILRLRTEFILYHEQNGKRYIVKPIQIVIEEYKPNKEVKPTFALEEYDSKEFIKSMAELAEELGIQTDKQLNKDKKFEGKLEATERHLEDMRNIVFNKKK